MIETLDLSAPIPANILDGQLFVSENRVDFDPDSVRSAIEHLGQAVVVVLEQGQVGVASPKDLQFDTSASGRQTIAYLTPLGPERLGSPAFREMHGVRFAYMAGSMANGIASDSLVIALGRAGILGSLGTAGQSLSAVEAAIRRIQSAIRYSRVFSGGDGAHVSQPCVR